MKIAVVGSGNMGTALARLLADNGHSVMCWDHMPEVVDDIRKNHQNSRFLSGVSLPSSISADLLLNHVVRGTDIVFIAVPAAFFRQVVKEFSPFSMPQTIVVGATKGMELSTGNLMSEVYGEAAVHPSDHYVALSGPSIANEFARQKPTAVVLACPNSSCLHKAKEVLVNPYFRMETTDDVTGVEWGGVLRNIYALGFGFLDGLNHGSSNLKSAFMALALKEMKQIACKLGAKPQTLDGFAGLGDLVMTSLSSDSPNRKLGESLAKGMEFDKAIAQLGGVEPEGVKNIQWVLEKIGSSLETPLACLIQNGLNQPAARTKFVDEVWKIIN
jgi:glycerol-3-phosphate dehydrogenase (NAD(P)+)